MSNDAALPFSVEEKGKSEYVYWWRRWKKEKKLFNHHYEQFYTTYFGIDKGFYQDKKIMDIGCGPRGSLEWAAGIAAAAVGVDPLVDEYSRFGISEHRMVYINAGAEHIPVPAESFDCVFAFNSIDHVNDVDASVAEIKRVTKPGGLFLFMVEINHKPTVQEPHNLSRSIVDTFGFEVENLRTYRENGTRGCYDTILNEANQCPDDGLTELWLTARMRKPL